MRFFDPFAEIRVTRNNLPHWQQPGAAYFITFRMADSLPEEMVRELDLERRCWLEKHPAPLSPEDEADFIAFFPRGWTNGWMMGMAPVCCASRRCEVWWRSH